MTKSMIPRIPKALVAEHEELHAELVKLTLRRGKVGEAARTVATLLHPHFVKEEEFALPPLGLLPALAKGTITPEMHPAIDMARRLKSELPRMLDEHKAIVVALKKLVDNSHKVHRSDIALFANIALFAEKLILHAQTEEEVLYPAAIVIGAYLEAKLEA